MAGQPQRIVPPPHPPQQCWFDVTELSVFSQVPNPSHPELQAPLSIIPVGAGFVVEVKFEMGGPTSQHFAAHHHAYTIKVFAESIGAGPEKKIGEFQGTLVTNQFQYADYVDVDAGELTELGVYKLVAVLTFDQPHPHGPYMVGFTDKPIMIQIKNPIGL